MRGIAKWATSLPAVAACASLAVACDPGVFEELESDAPTRVFGSIAGFEDGTFGARLASARGTFAGGVAGTRVAVTGGAGSPFAVYSMWTGTAPELGLRADGCDHADDGCPATFGAGVAGLPAFAGQGLCFAITSPGSAETRVHCEGETESSVIVGPALPADELGHSIAGVPEAGHPAGVAFLGAPGAASGAGALYRLVDAGGTHTPVALPGGVVLAPGDRFGDAMAAAVVGTDVLLAVTASGSDRVYVLEVGDDGGGVAAELLACLDGPEGFGAALAFGDLTGEGDVELVVGEALGAAGRADAVQVFALADLAGEAGCGVVAAPAPTVVTCPDDLGVTCAGSGFGSAVAVGDVDGDMVGDLLVGAPLATVDGATEAGAAFLLAGTMDGVASVGDERDVLVDSDPEAGARLGAAVATIGSHLGVTAPERDEPVASAPGEGKLYFFLCSELETIASLADSRCLELD